MGSGTTGKAALLEGYDFIGIEDKEDYVTLAHHRITWAVSNG
jgi:site-specific DNA-methyltransferase (adenine-specific)